MLDDTSDLLDLNALGNDDLVSTPKQRRRFATSQASLSGLSSTFDDIPSEDEGTLGACCCSKL